MAAGLPGVSLSTKVARTKRKNEKIGGKQEKPRGGLLKWVKKKKCRASLRDTETMKV
jgi:hypothetical protein